MRLVHGTPCVAPSKPGTEIAAISFRCLHCTRIREPGLSHNTRLTLPTPSTEAIMKNLILVSLALLLLIATSPTSAQQKKGDFELQFYGMYYRTVGTDYTFASGTIGGKIGPYLTDHFQIGIGPSLSISTSTPPPSLHNPNPESETTTTFGTSVFLLYSFLSSGGKLVPYFGAQWHKSDFNRPISEERGSAGVNAGLKYFFVKKTALDFSINYGWDLNPVEEGMPSRGGTLLFVFGLSFLF
jgi:hypothetical protein